ncbi:unnamed protein product [Pleuronectes platessa]|uniref:Uncharacterized protein n=1 Tax=Pleuronectes platessa TaxID=8262 RepID=A0A9N7Z5U2_PLEPL|nr:unnamed protein product [Pleuronectes platessa]
MSLSLTVTDYGTVPKRICPTLKLSVEISRSVELWLCASVRPSPARCHSHSPLRAALLPLQFSQSEEGERERERERGKQRRSVSAAVIAFRQACHIHCLLSEGIVPQTASPKKPARRTQHAALCCQGSAKPATGQGDHLGRVLLQCTTYLCQRQSNDRQLGTAVSCHSLPPLRLLPCPGTPFWFACTYASGTVLAAQLNIRLTKTLQKKSPERKQK